MLDSAVASTVNYFAPRLLSAFHKEYPGIQLELDVTNREKLIQMLIDNSVDMVLMGQPPANVEVECEAFMDNPLVVVAHTGVHRHELPPGARLGRHQQVGL